MSERDTGDTQRLQLQSQAIRLVAEGALALASLKGALDQRFPRQRSYVASFFLDVAPKRSDKKNEE